MPAATDTGSRWLPSLLVVLAVGIAWSNALQASFQFDDWDVIVRDPRVQSLAAWWSSMPGMRPVLKLSYALNHASGFGVVGFHAVNILIHAGNGLLILYLMRHLEMQTSQRSGGLAFAAALIFVLHPVQTEAVTYASGRSMSLSTFFALTSIAVWVAGRSARQHAVIYMYVASPLLMLLGIATKESAVMVPAILLLWAAADTSRPFSWRQVWRESALHWLLLLAAVPAALLLPAYQRFLATSLATRSVAENLVAQLHGIAYLLGQLLDIDHLNADPALPVLATLDLDGSLVLAGIVVAAGMALGNIRRFPLPAFAVLWFLLWMAPGNSLLARLDLVNDRQLYAALAGPALLLAAAIHRLGRQQRYLAVTGLSAVLLLEGFATHLRNDVYRDEAGFWRNVVAQSPHNARAWNNLGIALATECDLRRAEAAWRKALATDPGYVRAAVNLRLLDQGLLPEGLAPCRNLSPGDSL